MTMMMTTTMTLLCEGNSVVVIVVVVVLSRHHCHVTRHARTRASEGDITEDSKGEGGGMRTMAHVFVMLCVGRGRGLGEGATSLCAVVIIVTSWRRMKGR